MEAVIAIILSRDRKRISVCYDYVDIRMVHTINNCFNKFLQSNYVLGNEAVASSGKCCSQCEQLGLY